MPAGETSSAASVTPRISPVSCSGKKPFGITTNSNPVSATVPSITIRVTNRCRTALTRMRS